MKARILISISAFFIFFAAIAQTLPEGGKFYTIAMKTNASQYMVENADGSLGVTAYDKTQRIFWEFVPTGNANCYYMRNATTKRYVKSCAGAQKDRIYTSTERVEYYIATSGGYVRFTSTDCTNYDKTANSPNGLNKDGASSNIIVWAAGSSNNNSWWKLNETEYLFEQRTALPHTDFMRKAQIYDNPCATASDIYITYVQAQGPPEDGFLYYPAKGKTASKPSEAFQIFTTSKVLMRRGNQFDGTIRLSKAPQEGDSLYVYFDFNRDGEFDACVRPDMARNTSFIITVPEDAALGQSRMRVRLTNNGLAGADDEACGQTIDFIVRAFDSTATSILVQDTKKDISITADGSTLRASSPLGIAQMELFSATGARVGRTSSDHLSLDNIPSGIYVVKVRTSKRGETCSAKLFIK